MMKLLRKSLILTHRYMGIALSLLAVMWFAMPSRAFARSDS